MPKLAAKDRKKVEKAEAVTGEFPVWPAGKYIAELTEVEAKASAAGNPMWVAEFQNFTNSEGEVMPGRQWYNLNLPTSDTPPDGYEKGEEKWLQYQGLCSGRIKAFFEAFGYTVDSDTDEMIGDRVVVQIGIRTIQKGEKAGQQTNTINAVHPLDSVDFDGAEGEGSDDEF